jgi:peptidylprolyl isomerase
MRQVKQGDKITIDYEGRVKDGELFETTTETGPLQFEVGSNSVMPAFEQAVLGMKTDEVKIIEIPAENGYGPKLDHLVQSFNREVFDHRINPQVGMVLGMTMEKDGENKQVPGVVTEASDEQVTIDFNHPLAGRTLLFRITVKAIGETGKQEESCTPAAGSCPASGCSSCN